MFAACDSGLLESPRQSVHHAALAALFRRTSEQAMKTRTVHGRRVSRVLLFALICLGVFFSGPIRSDRYDLLARWQRADAPALRAAGSDMQRLSARGMP